MSSLDGCCERGGSGSWDRERTDGGRAVGCLTPGRDGPQSADSGGRHAPPTTTTSTHLYTDIPPSITDMTDQPLPPVPPGAPPGGGPQSQYHSHVAMETFSQHYQEAILSLKRRMLAEEAALEAMGLDRAGLYGPPPMSGGSANPLLPVSSSSSMPGPRGAEAGEDGGMSGGHPGVGAGGPGVGVTGAPLSAHPGPPPVVSAANPLHGPQTSDLTSPTTTTSSSTPGGQHHYHPGYHHPGGGGGGGGGMTPHHPADPLYGLLPGPGAGPPGGAPRTSRPDHDDDLDGSPTEHHLHHHQHHYPHHPHHHQGAITPMQVNVGEGSSPSRRWGRHRTARECFV